MTLLAGGLAKYLAPAAYRARARLAHSFEKYFEGSNQDQASDLVRDKYAKARTSSISIADCARLELFFLTVSTVNAVPAFFWLMAYVLSDTDLVIRIRLRLMNGGTLSQSDTAPGKRKIAINVSRINTTTCLLLMSAYHETLRTSNQNISNREVLRDTILSAPWCGVQLICVTCYGL